MLEIFCYEWMWGDYQGGEEDINLWKKAGRWERKGPGVKRKWDGMGWNGKRGRRVREAGGAG